jgi:hypothetical protein
MTLASQPFGIEPEGDGTQASPYLIATLENLVWISESPDDWDKHFLQTADIDFFDMIMNEEYWVGYEGWSPIGIDLEPLSSIQSRSTSRPTEGRVRKPTKQSQARNTSEPFTGVYDGGGFTISSILIQQLLYPDDKVAIEVGMFGWVSDAILKNLTFELPSISGTFDNISCIGVLAGYISDTDITNVKVFDAMFDISISHTVMAGVLVGYSAFSTIKHSQTTGSFINVIFDDEESWSEIGGLVGVADWYSLISECFSTVQISTNLIADVGGLAGILWDSDIENSYFHGAIMVAIDPDTWEPFNVEIIGGGLVGAIVDASMVTDCYVTSSVGFWGPLHLPETSFGIAAFVEDTAVISGVFFNSETTGVLVAVGDGPSAGITAKTTFDMTDIGTYMDDPANWDFDFVWAWDPFVNSGYPHLQNNEPVGGGGGGVFLDYIVNAYLSGYSVVLQWHANAFFGDPPNFDEFKVYRTLLDENFEVTGERVTVATLPGTARTFTDSPGTANANYLYQLTGIIGETETDPEYDYIVVTIRTVNYTTDPLVLDFADVAIPDDYYAPPVLAGWTTFSGQIANPTAITGFTPHWSFFAIDWAEWDGQQYAEFFSWDAREDGVAEWLVTPSISGLALNGLYKLDIQMAFANWRGDECQDNYCEEWGCDCIAKLSDDTRVAIVVSRDNGVTWSANNIIGERTGDELLEFFVECEPWGTDMTEIEGETVSVYFQGADRVKLAIYVENGTEKTNYNLWILGMEITYDSVSDDDIALPVVQTALRPNFPNPFNPETSISFTVDNSLNPVSIDIYNIRGQKVRSLVDDIFTTGDHSVVWNGTDDKGRSVGSGVYFYRMSTGDFTETRKMVLIK